jgi:hypothetical protein
MALHSELHLAVWPSGYLGASACMSLPQPDNSPGEAGEGRYLMMCKGFSDHQKRSK